MDPKRFYKRAEKGRFATKFAVGTVVEGPAEFFSSEASALSLLLTLDALSLTLHLL